MSSFRTSLDFVEKQNFTSDPTPKLSQDAITFNRLYDRLKMPIGYAVEKAKTTLRGMGKNKYKKYIHEIQRRCQLFLKSKSVSKNVFNKSSKTLIYKTNNKQITRKDIYDYDKLERYLETYYYTQSLKMNQSSCLVSKVFQQSKSNFKTQGIQQSVLKPNTLRSMYKPFHSSRKLQKTWF